MEGRQRSSAKITERQEWGDEEIVPKSHLEQKLVTLLEKAKLGGNHLVLAAFGADSELNAMAKFFPRVATLFSWWIDVQKVVKHLDTTLHNVPWWRPSLAKTLKALGFDAYNTGGMSKRISHHNSAKDALRILAVLVRVGRMVKVGERFTLQAERRPRRKYPNVKPHPNELYPFIIKVFMKGRRCLTEELREADLWELFSAYQPTAISKRMRHCNSCLWVCFPSRDLLKKFVQDYPDNKQMLEGILRVRDDSNPGAVTPMEKMVYDESKRREREDKRHRDESIDALDDLALTFDWALESVIAASARRP